MTTWAVQVALSRWRNRLRYLVMAPIVYRNWWAMAFPKLGISTVLRLRDGSCYFVRAHTLDLSVVNEAAFLNPYLKSGYVRIAPDATVIDVGANIGDFTIQAARLCPNGRVIAIEPLKEAGALIERQAALNGLTNITWICAALSGADGATSANREGSIYATAASSAQQVPMMSLGRLVADLGLVRIDLLKLDCEGAEWDILPAAEPLLGRVRQICMEYHAERGWTPQRLARWLEGLGFEVQHTRGTWNGLLWARRPTLL
jgi:FkbM family methyltransferase